MVKEFIEKMRYEMDSLEPYYNSVGLKKPYLIENKLYRCQCGKLCSKNNYLNICDMCHSSVIERPSYTDLHDNILINIDRLEKYSTNSRRSKDQIKIKDYMVDIGLEFSDFQSIKNNEEIRGLMI